MRKRILIVAPFFPDSNSAQAGHRLLYELIADMSKIFEVSLFLILSSKEELPARYQIPCKNVYIYTLGYASRLFSMLTNFLTFSPRFNTRFSKTIARKLLQLEENENFYYIRFEFSQTFPYAFYAKSQNLSSKIIMGVHDLQIQLILRKGFLESFLFSKFTFDSEKKLLNSADSVSVLCRKDANLVIALYGSCIKVNVETPKVSPWVKNIVRDKSRVLKHTILFIGAMNRVENEDGILWFINEIFMPVRRKLGVGLLYVVGAKPSKRVLRYQCSFIEVTGYVEDPSSYFESASCAVVPLRSGAGIKIKTLEMIEAGIPVITTDIGAEGIDISGKDVAIANSIDAFTKELETKLTALEN